MTPHTALLWDLDNVSTRRADLASMAQVVADLVQPAAARIAAAHRRSWRSCQTALTTAGFEVISGGRRSNGADRLLLQQARLLHRQGVTQFVVASNDHFFVEVASFADLHVVTLSDAYLSARLRAAAESVTVLVRDGDGWRVGHHRPNPDSASGID